MNGEGCNRLTLHLQVQVDITLTSTGKARLTCQLFAKYRSTDLAMSLRNVSC